MFAWPKHVSFSKWVIVGKRQAASGHAAAIVAVLETELAKDVPFSSSDNDLFFPRDEL